MNQPWEVTELATRVNTEFKRVMHAERQLKGWQNEFALAQASLKAAQAEYADVLNRWDTVSDKVAPKDLQDAPAPANNQ